MTNSTELGSERFVALTTFRRNGEGVPTAVWMVADRSDLLVWTAGSTGKVKRLRRDNRIDLAPCSRRGTVAPDAPHTAGTATVEDDPSSRALTERLLRHKYGIEYVLVSRVERAIAVVRRRPVHRVVLRIRTP